MLSSADFLDILATHAHTQDANTLRQAFDILRDAHTHQSRMTALHFRPGMRVEFDCKKRKFGNRTVTGIVTDVRGKTVKVLEDAKNGGVPMTWRVGATLLREAKGAA